jgi:hypothetical protein
MSFLVKLKKANALNIGLYFDTLPDWRVLAKHIEEQYSVSPENINLDFLKDGRISRITNEQDLQNFYEQHDHSSKKIKFVVQDLQAPDCESPAFNPATYLP